jgi:hypothetical protein
MLAMFYQWQKAPKSFIFWNVLTTSFLSNLSVLYILMLKLFVPQILGKNNNIMFIHALGVIELFFTWVDKVLNYFSKLVKNL